MKKLLFLMMLLPLVGMAQRDWSKIDVTELAPGLHRLFVSNSVAVVAFVGPDGVFVVDAAYEQSAEHLMTEIGKLSDGPVKYLVNSHLHADHTGGNKIIGKDAIIIAHASVRDYLSKEQRRGETVIPAFPENALPGQLVEGKTEVTFNNQKINITHLGGGHTAGDLVVFFPTSNVVVIADLLFAGYFPYVDTGNGGNPLKYLENVAKIIEDYPVNATVVGGHGPVFTMNELKQWHNTLTETIAVIRQAKSDGMTAEQMKENRILKQWESMGAFFITEDRWIDTIVPFI